VSPLTVVFICAGNTCRSPLAMALARRSWPEQVTFLSAGLQAIAGQAATEPAMAVAVERGASLADHRSQPVDAGLLAQADWLIAMTRSQVALLKARRGTADRARIGLLGCPNEDLADRETPAVEEIGDPFGADVDTYRATADQLDRLLAAWGPTFTGNTGGST